MANVSKTVEIIFGGKDELSRVVDQIGYKFGGLEDFTSTLTEPLSRAAKSIEAIDAALLALAVGGMAYALKESGEFNKSFGLISTSVTATGADLEKYRSDILNYATTSVSNLEQINAALYTAAQAGVQYTDSLEFIRRSEELAVANKANLNTTVDLLTGTMNAYGFTVEDVAHLNDVYFQSTLIGKQTIDELGQSMGNVVGIAANSGVSFEELSAAIATLTAKGMQTPEAITAIKGVITSIISPSKEAAEAARALGLNFSLTEMNSRGFAVLLTEIMNRTGGSKERMVELFSEVRAMNGVLSLTGDGMRFFNDALDEIVHSSGAAAAAYQKMAETFSNQMQTIENVAKVTMISIGTELEPAAAKVAGAFASMLAGIKIGVDAGAFDPLFAYLDQVAGSLSQWFRGIGEAMPEALSKVDFAALIAAFNDLGRAISDYFGGLDLTRAEDLGTALQTVVDIVTGIVNVTTGMADAFRPFVQAIANFFIEVARGDEETQKTMGKILAFAQAIETLGLGFASAIMTISEYRVSITGLFNAIAGGAQVMWNGLQIVVEAVKGACIAMAGMIISVLDDMTYGFFPGLDKAKEKLTEWGKSIDFSQDAEDARRGLFRMMEGIEQLGTESGKAAEQAKGLKSGLLDIPAQTTPKIDFDGWIDARNEVDQVRNALNELPATKGVTIEVLADGTTIEQAKGMIKKTFPDGSVMITNLGLSVDEASLKSASGRIDAAVPKKKTIDAELKIDEARIKERAATVQKAMEWKAKVDIAQIEAATKQVEETFKNLGTRIESTGSVIDKLLGALADENLGTSQKWGIEEMLEDEAEARKKAMEQSAKLTEQQIELNKLKLSAMERGTSMIRISADGLKPHLEMILWEILEAIQIRANESGSEFLLGVS